MIFWNKRSSGLEFSIICYLIIILLSYKIKGLSQIRTFFVAKSTLCNSVDWGLLDNIEVGPEPATSWGLMALPVAEKEKTRRKRKMEEKTGIRRKRPFGTFFKNSSDLAQPSFPKVIRPCITKFRVLIHALYSCLPQIKHSELSLLFIVQSNIK